MNPWMWLLWAVVAIIVLFILTVVIAGIWQGIRTPTPCPHCGKTPDEKPNPSPNHPTMLRKRDMN